MWLPCHIINLNVSCSTIILAFMASMELCSALQDQKIKLRLRSNYNSICTKTDTKNSICIIINFIMPKHTTCKQRQPIVMYTTFLLGDCSSASSFVSAVSSTATQQCTKYNICILQGNSEFQMQHTWDTYIATSQKGHPSTVSKPPRNKDTYGYNIQQCATCLGILWRHSCIWMST